MDKETENLVDLKKVEKLFTDGMDVLKTSGERAEAEGKDAGTASVETKAAIEKQAKTLNELGDRIQVIEQKGVKIDKSDNEPYDIGAEFIKSEQFEALQKGQQGRARRDRYLAEEIPAGAEAIGGDDLLTRLFWDAADPN